MVARETLIQPDQLVRGWLLTRLIVRPKEIADDIYQRMNLLPWKTWLQNDLEL